MLEYSLLSHNVSGQDGSRRHQWTSTTVRSTVPCILHNTCRCIRAAMDELVRRFQWCDVVWNVLSQHLTSAQIQASMLCHCQGSDSDFTGHGCWEMAVSMLQASFRRRGIVLDLEPRAASAAWPVTVAAFRLCTACSRLPHMTCQSRTSMHIVNPISCKLFLPMSASSATS